ncbi:MAG: cobalamin biosynthesis protein CobG, partial [Pseudomonadota bacterium]
AIDLTSRANLQIRGVSEAGYPELLDRLITLGLVPPEPTDELPLTVTPFPDADGLTERLVDALASVAGSLPALPDKMGIIVDTGDQRWLDDVSGDFRFERGSGHGLLLRADGVALGRPVSVGTAAGALLEMAEWFVSTGGRASRRMRRHTETENPPEAWRRVLPVAVDLPGVGPDISAGILGLPFGRLHASDLVSLCQLPGIVYVVFTPWRLIQLQGLDGMPADISHGSATAAALSAFVTDISDPLLNIAACPGAPSCASATVDTRALAEEIAEAGAGPVHISGCQKGCAHRDPVALTLVGRESAFDLVRHGRASDTPLRSGLSAADVLALFDAEQTTDLETPGRTQERAKTR